MKEEQLKQRKEIFAEIMKVIKNWTNLDGKINAESFKKELLIEVFPEIGFEDGLIEYKD